MMAFYIKNSYEPMNPQHKTQWFKKKNYLFIFNAFNSTRVLLFLTQLDPLYQNKFIPQY